MTIFPRGVGLGLVSCRFCGRTMPRGAADRPVRCTRCGRSTTTRITHSPERTLAWLLTGIILYLPANILPVMHTQGPRGDEDSTILGGIVEFWQAGSWDIALLIFIASVAVPVTKFVALGLLVWSVRWRTDWAREERTRLYRFVDSIGHWSMLDVVVVAITCSLLQFKELANAEPRPGILYFCGVVVVTMMAARSFDARLIWDAPVPPP